MSLRGLSELDDETPKKLIVKKYVQSFADVLK